VPFPDALRSHSLSIDANGAVLFAPKLDAEVDAAPEPWRQSSERTACESSKAGRRVGRAVDSIMAGFRAHVATDGDPNVAIFLHGGLVDADGGLRDSEALLAAMESEDFYPIFVNWDTGILSSYGDYLFSVRRGQARPVEAFFTFPFVLLADATRAVGRAPVYLARQLSQIPKNLRLDVEPVSDFWSSSATLDDRPYKKSWLQRAPGLALQIFPGVLRIVTTPLLDAIGDGAYQNMLRRAHVLFLLDEDFDTTERRECGALSRLMAGLRSYELELKGRSDEGSRNRGNDPVTKLRALQAAHRPLSEDDPEREKVAQDREAAEIELADDASVVYIQIFAHSMGAIVANELLHRNGDLYFSDVVYMGAACSIKDFAALALPYLRANPTTRFTNLTLHPERESFETNAWLTVPRGSLLDWIDLYLTTSKSELDRTLGSWNNIARALPVIDYLEADERARLSVRGFGLSPGQPRKHGEFNDPPCAPDCVEGRYPGAAFWKPAFREASTIAEASAPGRGA
jgi:hypothetical protein